LLLLALATQVLLSMKTLLRNNMSKFTNTAKLAESCESLTRKCMRTVAIISGAGTLHGYASYELKTKEGDEPTDYLYELQLHDDAVGKGLGAALMAVVESKAQTFGSNRVMLTTHKKNKRALHFFKLQVSELRTKRFCSTSPTPPLMNRVSCSADTGG
jgi:hypothetical protein